MVLFISMLLNTKSALLYQQQGGVYGQTQWGTKQWSIEGVRCGETVFPSPLEKGLGGVCENVILHLEMVCFDAF